MLLQLFTSMASIVQFAILKRMIWSYALPLLIVGFIASFMGQVLASLCVGSLLLQISLSWLVRRYNRKSYIVFLIVIVLSLSAIMMIVRNQCLVCVC